MSEDDDKFVEALVIVIFCFGIFFAYIGTIKNCEAGQQKRIVDGVEICEAGCIVPAGHVDADWIETHKCINGTWVVI